MRALLGILLCVILLQSQVFALSGGPQYGRVRGDDAFLGNYSGALLARNVSPIDGTITDPSQPAYISAVGIFAATVSDSASSIGSGQFIVFNQGEVNRGTLDIVPGASGGKINGVLEAATASGTLEAKLENRSPMESAVVTAAIRGKADLRFVSPLLETITFKVIGYQSTL